MGSNLGSNRRRKLAVSSIRNNRSATCPRGRTGLHAAFPFLVHRIAGLGTTLLQLCDGGIGVLRPYCDDVFQTAPGVVDEQQVDVFPFEAAVVTQPVSVDEGYVAFTVFGDDFLSAGLYFVGQLGQMCACLGEWHHIAGRNAHGCPLEKS
jgi:hypothetical protein